MRRIVKGSMTIFLSLLMMTFLLFCMVLLEGVRNYCLRVEAQQAMELAEFSVLSEYQQELFQNYGLFFVDLDYEQGEELVSVLEQRAEKYLLENAEECETLELRAENFRKATDEEGTAFFRQAVEQMKLESGYKVFEELIDFAGADKEMVPDVGELLSENEEAAKEILDSSVDENGLPLFDISLPRLSFPTVNVLTEAVFGNLGGLSETEIDLEERLLKRTLEKGAGKKAHISFSDMQLFHTYLLKYCNYYGKKQEHKSKNVLEYQMEYIISGKNNDRENLEEVMWRIFLLRAGGNYLFYHQDSEQLAIAQAEAAAIAGVSANPVLIDVVKEILLISKAVETSIQETKSLFEGGKVPLYEDGVFSTIELGYEEYLYLLLNVTGKKEKVYRCMDIVELEVRELSGYKSFRLDHCTDSFSLVWTYAFDSLFLKIPLLPQENYENTITKKIFYEN